MTVREMPMQSAETIVTTREQITKVFAEWVKRFEETPEEFRVNDFSEGYAEDSTDFFIKLLHEVS
jgi:polyhydroxyalkanoate synthesis regulator phasin